MRSWRTLRSPGKLSVIGVVIHGNHERKKSGYVQNVKVPIGTERKVNMGDLARLSKSNSNFLKIDKGETVLVQYLDYRIIPSNLDPTKDTVQYRFEFDGKIKFWTNSSSGVMMVFDELKKGSWVKISRGKWITKDGKEDTSKSAYTAEVVNGSSKGQAPAASEEVAWDDDK